MTEAVDSVTKDRLEHEKLWGELRHLRESGAYPDKVRTLESFATEAAPAAPAASKTLGRPGS